MAKIVKLPAIIIDYPISLPGSNLHLILDTVTFHDTLKLAEDNYDSDIVIFFKRDDAKGINDYPVGVYSHILAEKKASDNTISVDLLLASRAFATGKSELLKRSYIVEFDIPPVVKTAEDLDKQVMFYVRNNVLENGVEFLTDSSLIFNMLGTDLEDEVLCDMVLQNISTIDVPLQEILDTRDFHDRLTTLAHYIDIINQQVELSDKIETDLCSELTQEQKEYYLRKKIRKIQEELGDVDDATADSEELRNAINNAGMPPKVKEHVMKEFRRYQSTSSISPEYGMIRNYLDIMLEIPWKAESKDEVDIDKAKAVLDSTHFGLEKVKDRILEYLSVKLYTGKNPQTIICFAGPPGVGKTTLAKSIAEALGRKFVKQSLGGVKDEAEIRGHRRTYIGALPGRIIDGMREAKVKNPVFLLDEIDKLGADYKGDPSASLLEVLDPAQNAHFRDHYVADEYDLSDVMFICTANYLENVPAPLLDRMEIIELSSYTEFEKYHICREHVIKKVLKENGLEEEKFEITDEAIYEIIKRYTREAGARQLERCIGSIVRKSIRKILSEKCKKVSVDVDMIHEMLGKPYFDYDKANEEDEVGVATGLAWTSAGGDILQIEVSLCAGSGRLQLTGQLGDVMIESAQAAFSLFKAHAEDFDIKPEEIDAIDVHIHVPDGATPKDGPSAGITITTAIISAFTGLPIRHDLGMTGEITLRGKVLPIGGLKEKSIAAHRSGLKEILIPKENLRDLEDIPEEVKKDLKITPVSSIQEVLDLALVPVEDTEEEKTEQKDL